MVVVVGFLVVVVSKILSSSVDGSAVVSATVGFALCGFLAMVLKCAGLSICVWMPASSGDVVTYWYSSGRMVGIHVVSVVIGS